MKNEQLKLSGNPKPDAHEDRILVRDVVRHLSGLAKLHADEKVGNPALSEGLRQITKALRPYATCPADELDSVLREIRTAQKRPPKKVKSTLPPNLESIDEDGIEKVLSDENYTKSQIAELGYKRFGISQSALARISKEDALISIRAALENERTLDVISQVARESAKARAFPKKPSSAARLKADTIKNTGA